MRTLAVIPARAGSKGIPGKNTRRFAGKPLVSWAIEVGKRTCDRVVVTSDDSEVLAIAEAHKVNALERPKELAQDETPMLDVLTHVLACEPDPTDCLVLLQPTSPLRQEKHVREARWALTLKPHADSVVSVVEIPPHMSPDWAMALELGTGYLRPVMDGRYPTRRQDCRAAYYRDGTVYAIRTGTLRRGELYGRSLPLLIPASESCTIDTEEDWARAEQMWRDTHVCV